MMAAVFARYELRVQQRHFAGLQQGIDGEDLVAQVLRASDKSSLTPVQEVYKDKVKAKLAEVHLACALSAAALFHQFQCLRLRHVLWSLSRWHTDCHYSSLFFVSLSLS